MAQIEMYGKTIVFDLSQVYGGIRSGGNYGQYQMEEALKAISTQPKEKTISTLENLSKRYTVFVSIQDLTLGDKLRILEDPSVPLLLPEQKKAVQNSIDLFRKTAKELKD